MKKTNKLILAAVLAVALPTGAFAADVDLQVKIDKLSQQMEDLKGQVERIEDKSLGKWLTIGGSYQFRMDSLHGQTAAYTSPMGMFGYLQQNALYNLGAGFGNMTVGQVLTLANANMGSVTNYTSASLQSAAFMTQLNNVYAAVAGAYTGPAGPVTNPAGKVQIPAYKPKNETIYTNKFALDLKAKATKDVTVNVKLGMYKVFGSQDDNAVTGDAYFADRTGVFDGTLGHVPSSSYLNVDRAYATWSNIMDQPVWFSVGRRPATDGAPTNLKSNNERPGNGGTPALLVNYAFDGMTLGYAPDIDMLPGFYTKVCYGRGFDSGFRSTPTNSLKDTDMLGVAVIPVDTDPLRVWMQWNRGFNIFDFPVMQNTAFGNTAPSVNLGSIDWFGLGGMSTLKKVGPGDLNFFVDGGLSMTHPTTAVSANAMFQGLLTGSPMNPEAPSDKTGYAVFAGVRYDLPSKTKLGFEYNYGSKNWITFSPAADDMFTSKVGTRGHVFEPYVIQELNLKPISSIFAKTFFKLGYQYYDFEYTGSNNWVGAPQKISDLAAFQANGGMLLQAPVKNAHDIYGTFEVHF
jgi:opacity protein-like surface antigen